MYKSIACWSVFSSLFSVSSCINIQFGLEYCSWRSILNLFDSFVHFRHCSIYFSIFFSFSLLSCSYASNLSSINDIALLTSRNASSTLIWLSLDFLAKSSVSFTDYSKLRKKFAKINTQLGFFKSSAKTLLKVLVEDSFLLSSFCFFGSSPVPDCSLLRTLFLDDFTSKYFAISMISNTNTKNSNCRSSMLYYSCRNIQSNI